MQKEGVFKKKLKDRLEKEFPGCIVLKNDASYVQGIPDLIVLHKDKWAMLETKESEAAKHQPNQDYYVSKLGEMSYASFVYPENIEEVFHDLRETFGSDGKACVSGSE